MSLTYSNLTINVIKERLDLLNIKETHIPILEKILNLEYTFFYSIITRILTGDFLLDDFIENIQKFNYKRFDASYINESEKSYEMAELIDLLDRKQREYIVMDLIISNPYDREIMQELIIQRYNKENPENPLSVSAEKNIYVDTINHIVTDELDKIKLTDSSLFIAYLKEKKLINIKKDKQLLFNNILARG